VRVLPVPSGGHLTPAQKQQVAVLFEAILPGTDDAPGATEAGAADFLDVLLSADGEVFYEVPAWRRTYGSALPALDAVAGERFGHPLAELTPDEARDLLTDLAAGGLAGMPDDIDQRRLFTTLRNHCIEGCFSDPRWGGNRDQAVWRWLGYGRPPEPPVLPAGGAVVVATGLSLTMSDGEQVTTLEAGSVGLVPTGADADPGGPADAATVADDRADADHGADADDGADADVPVDTDAIAEAMRSSGINPPHAGPTGMGGVSEVAP
jgi:hypothetical protein